MAAVTPQAAPPTHPVVILDIAGTWPQMEFWRASHRFRAIVGGVGSGKTRGGAVEVLRQPAGSLGMVVAPTYKMLAQATYPGLMDVLQPLLPASGVKPLPYEPDAPIDLVESFNKSDWRLTLRNGTRILFRSGEDPDYLRGPSLSWWWLDEGAMCSEMVLLQLLARLRVAPERGWITTTPRGYNWLYKRFVQDKTPDYFLVYAPTNSNNYTSRSYKESLAQAYSGVYAQQELEGEFVEFVDAPCYPSYKRSIHVRPGLLAEYDPYKPLAICCDFNVRYMCWPVFQYDQRNDVDRCISEVVMRRPAETAAMVELFRVAFPAHQGPLEIYGDASGRATSTKSHRSDYDIIRDAFRGYTVQPSFKVSQANPPVRDRVLAVNMRLRDLDGVSHFLFDADNAKETTLDVSQTGWDKSGNRELQIDDPDDDRCERTHASSAVGYRTYAKWPTSKARLNANAAKGRPQPRVGRMIGEL